MSQAGCLERAVVGLLRERPFYGHFILNLRREIRSLPDKQAGITIRDGIPILAVDSTRFNLLTTLEQRALLEHLVKHLLHLHMARRKNRNRQDWDICCDLAINTGIPGLPADAPLPGHYSADEGLAAEEYYDLLVPPFDTGNLSGTGYGDADRSEQGALCEGRRPLAGTTLDDHSLWDESDSTPFSLAEEMVRCITRESLRGSDGETTAEIRTVVDNLLQPPAIPWQQILRQFVATAGRTGRTTTWMREHRRFSHDTPGIRKRGRLNLLVGIDISDSTNIIAIREAFAAELSRIARGRNASVTVLYANSRIQRIESFIGQNGIVHRYDGGGFTDLRPVFTYARTMRPLPAAVIYLTDGFGPAPEDMEFPTLWVLTGEGEKPVPWGLELRLEI